MTFYDKVAIERCEEYRSDEILSRLRVMAEGIGLSRESVRGKRVVIKPNLLLAVPPEKAATTHPSLVEAVASLLSEWEAGEVILAESPGGIYGEKALEKVYRVTGMKEASEKCRLKLNFDTGCRNFSTPEGKVSKSVTVINPIAEADVIFNLCKMKTHTLAVMTGAAKNLFGVIPGVTKFEMHARFKQPTDFFSMLIDLDEALGKEKKIVSICDGIVGMEGDGPSGGTPKKAGVLLMSENPFNLDIASAEVMGLSGRVPLLKLAAGRGLCPETAEGLSVVGIKPSAVGCGAFALPDTAKGKAFEKIPKFLQPHPEVSASLCRGCGVCVRSCPQKTISLTDGKGKKGKGVVARIARKSCIRCYCCQELCPFHAIKIKKSVIYRILE